MFESKIKQLKDGRSQKYLIYQGADRISFGDVLHLLESNQDFRAFFIDLLSEVDYRAYQWETPTLQQKTLDQPFEFVVTRNPGIDLPPDAGPFRQYFNAADDQVAVFSNLGGDAILIAPTPAGSLNYSHIGVFTRQAAADQQHALWEAVGRETRQRVSADPLWLNTAGGGVSWLHVRLDSSPKYYKHHPYTRTD